MPKHRIFVLSTSAEMTCQNALWLIEIHGTFSHSVGPLSLQQYCYSIGESMEIGGKTLSLQAKST